MKRFNDWLDSMGQNPKTAVRDVIWLLIRFYALTCFVVLPLFPIVKLLKPYLPAPSANQTINIVKLPPTQLFLFMAGFGIYMCFGVALMLALLGRWYQLFRKFPAPKRFREGLLFRNQSASVGACNYNHVLKIRVSPDGFYLACFFPFSIMHRPILIPWSEFKDLRQKRVWRRTSTRFIIGSPKIASIVVENPKVVEAAKPFLAQLHFL